MGLWIGRTLPPRHKLPCCHSIFLRGVRTPAGYGSARHLLSLITCDDPSAWCKVPLLGCIWSISLKHPDMVAEIGFVWRHFVLTLLFSVIPFSPCLYYKSALHVCSRTMHVRRHTIMSTVFSSDWKITMLNVPYIKSRVCSLQIFHIFEIQVSHKQYLWCPAATMYGSILSASARQSCHLPPHCELKRRDRI